LCYFFFNFNKTEDIEKQAVVQAIIPEMSNSLRNADSVSVPLSGAKDVKPGIWKLQCVSSTLNGGSAQVLLSDPEICNSNIDIREV